MMKASELTSDNIGQWFRFSHDGFERFGRLTRIEFSNKYGTINEVTITLAWKTVDDLTGVAYAIKVDSEFTPVDAPEPSDAA
jgi:hypothetical protein